MTIKGGCLIAVIAVIMVLLGVTYAQNGDSSKVRSQEDLLEEWLKSVERDPYWQSLPWCPGHGPDATPISTPTPLPPGVMPTPTPTLSAPSFNADGFPDGPACKVMPRVIIEILEGDPSVGMNPTQWEWLKQRGLLPDGFEVGD